MTDSGFLTCTLAVHRFRDVLDRFDAALHVLFASVTLSSVLVCFLRRHLILIWSSVDI